jgi:hypothetical protein
MVALASEYELEALPELESPHAYQAEGDRESEQFFGALANLARSGVGWLTAAGSPQRQAALSLARQAINQGIPALGRMAGGQGGSWLSGLLPQQEFEWESEFEISPIRKIYPDAMMEHLGHAAAETESEFEAESLAGAMIPLAASIVPRAAPTLTRATPGLVCGVSSIVRTLRNTPNMRPLTRVVPAIVKGTAVRIAQQSARGATVTPRSAVRMLGQQTARILGSPRLSASAFRRSQILDRQLHRSCGTLPGTSRACPHCGGRTW